jgi:hypothetical protein
VVSFPFYVCPQLKSSQGITEPIYSPYVSFYKIFTTLDWPQFLYLNTISVTDQIWTRLNCICRLKDRILKRITRHITCGKWISEFLISFIANISSVWIRFSHISSLLKGVIGQAQAVRKGIEYSVEANQPRFSNPSALLFRLLENLMLRRVTGKRPREGDEDGFNWRASVQGTELHVSLSEYHLEITLFHECDH